VTTHTAPPAVCTVVPGEHSGGGAADALWAMARAASAVASSHSAARPLDLRAVICLSSWLDQRGRGATASQKPQLCCISIVDAGVSALSPAGTSDITSGLRGV
jgi:hypothetical protein